MEWKTIETAPKDGTKILGFAQNGAMDKMATVFWFELGEYWSLVVTGAWADDSEWRPTHWMPLPEPPN